MTDWNELSPPKVSDIDRSQIPANPRDFSPPEPIWRYRRPLDGCGIARSVQTQILPEIGFALRSMSSPATPAPADPAAPFEVQQFTLLIIGADESAASAYVESLIARGAPTDLIFLNLLAPAARRLGEMWEADTADFANVTLGVSRLQRILRHLGENYSATEGVQRIGAVLLTTITGEQHSFGLAMIAEFFRHNGWDICTGPFASHRELSALVAERWFDVVGFSVSSDRRLDELKRDIHDVRRASRNRRIGIMVGGPLLVHRPELSASLDADLIANEGASAPQLARDLVAALKGRT
ncbi:cobalamin B12-binding [Rhodopseudomonas palustris BisB5]|uniref:Cobalamin B12-binding n=1 Tax=Rhodopseudomonas palustris (strain BisB5) TaxID=316057 RepID=Q132N0_RHOPS|nr:cobalamin B12-binding [Rhodopseudomonas palustris BisB5]